MSEEEEEEPCRKELLHGMYHWQIEEVDNEQSYQRLEKAGLKNSTKALIMAAQEKALSTRTTEPRVYQTKPYV